MIRSNGECSAHPLSVLTPLGHLSRRERQGAAANAVRHFGVRDSQKVHLSFMIRTFFHRIITAYKETISLCDFLSPYQTKQEAPPHGGASCFVPAKRVNPFCRKSFRCALRLGWPLAACDTPLRAKCFLRRTRRRKKRIGSFSRRARRELCETLKKPRRTAGLPALFIPHAISATREIRARPDRRRRCGG